MEDRPPWRPQSIRAHLLQAPPFADGEADQLWARTYTPRVAFPCRDKPQLVIALVQALQRYFDTVDLAKDVPSPEQLQQTWQAALWDVSQLLLGYEKLRKSRRLSQAARAHIPSIHARTLQNYERFLLQVRESLTPEDYAEMARDLLPSRHQYILEEAMLRAFTRYGPLQKRGAFSETAMYDAIAAILIHFAIEHRQRHTVVSRLRKTQQRARKSP